MLPELLVLKALSRTTVELWGEAGRRWLDDLPRLVADAPSAAC